jgi:hypothetical protein
MIISVEDDMDQAEIKAELTRAFKLVQRYQLEGEQQSSLVFDAKKIVDRIPGSAFGHLTKPQYDGIFEAATFLDRWCEYYDGEDLARVFCALEAMAEVESPYDHEKEVKAAKARVIVKRAARKALLNPPTGRKFRKEVV